MTDFPPDAPARTGHLSRRRYLARMGSFAAMAPLIGAVSACQTAGGVEDIDSSSATLLVPLSGEYAALGRNMRRAAEIAAPVDDEVLRVTVEDSAGPGGPAGAAAARGASADIVLGPLFGTDIPAVRAAIGPQTPIISFSNDPTVTAPGTFSVGLTPAQSVASILSYARGQGVRRVMVIAAPGDYGRAAAAAAEDVSRQVDMEIVGVLVRQPGALSRDELLGDIRREAGGRGPDALLLPDGGQALARFGDLLGGSGYQLLGTAQWGGRDADTATSLRGAWIAAPDPKPLARFSDGFRARFGETPGIVTALAHDAVVIARTAALTGSVAEPQLLRGAGFRGVLGPYRFTESGACLREMAILSPGARGLEVVYSPSVA